MKNLFFLFSALSLFFSGTSTDRLQPVSDESLTASVFFVDSVTSEGLQKKYSTYAEKKERVKILVVPGHDSEQGGAEFRGVSEAEMTAELGRELASFLQEDPRYEVVLARTSQGYLPALEDYFTRQKKEIQQFSLEHKSTMRGLLESGALQDVEGVEHNNAPSSTVVKLYGVNKWANENGVDLAIHIHFNDYAGRRRSVAGRYSGFAIYVPEAQYSNAKASRAIAEPIFGRLNRFFASSDISGERGGIIPDQDLIAIGANNTLNGASVLIEYGYIYEQAFRAPTRNVVLRELAYQTYRGLKDFFGNSADVKRPFGTTFLPVAWNEKLEQGVLHRPLVLSLQSALLLEGFYPPEGETLNSCPLSGSYGPCTAKAVKAFQKKHKIYDEKSVGEKTVEILKNLYGESLTARK